MPTQRPFRLRCLDNLTSILTEITPANGYNFDLSGNGQVVRGRLFIGDDEPVPMVSIVEPPAAVEAILSQPDNTDRVGEWDLLIQGWAKDDKSHPTDNAYILVADVQKRLAAEKSKPSARPGSGLGHDFLGMGPNILDFRIGQPVVRPPDNESRFAQFYLILTLKISEDTADPFR